MWGDFLDYSLDFLYQTVCPVCGELDSEGLVCSDCIALRTIEHFCLRCGEPLTQAMKDCDRCRAVEMRWITQMRSLLILTEKDRRILKLIKFRDHIKLLELYREAFRDYFSFPSVAGTVLVPIPLHWRRHFRRGYNVAAILAGWVSEQTSSPVVHHLLMKEKATPQQSGLSSQERRTNLRGSFQICRKAPIPRRVLLIDDVTTTGATLMHCARVLKKHGVEEVGAWTLFRTPK